MLRVVALVAAIGLAVGGCGGNGDDPGGSPGAAVDDDPSATSPPVSTTPEVTIEFVEVAPADEGGLVALVPSGWEPDADFPDKYEPPEDGPFGFTSPNYRVNLQCLGVCEPLTAEQWAGRFDVANGPWRESEDREVVRDEVTATGGLFEARSSEWSNVFIARWADGGDRVLTCQLSIHQDHYDLIADFEAACAASTAPGLPG